MTPSNTWNIGGRSAQRRWRLGRRWFRTQRYAVARWLWPPLSVRGELAAARHLRRQGYLIVGRNVRTRRSELDLVAVDGRTLVFVEVKTLASAERFHPAEMVDQEKQRRLTRAALAYLKRHDLLEQPARFDVVAITWPPGQRAPHIDHFQSAFEPVGRGQMFV